MSERKATQRKKLLDDIRFRLIDLRALAVPEPAEAARKQDVIVED